MLHAVTIATNAAEIVVSMASSNDIIVDTGAYIFDATGHPWTIRNGQVLINGVVDPTTANVTQLAYANGVVWQENSSNLWWSKTSPSASWQPPYGTATVPVPITVSPNNTIISAVAGTSTSTITDASANTWYILGGSVVVDGVVDHTTANVTHLAYVNGQIWQENTNDLWWSKTTPASPWSPTYGTTTVPVPIVASANNTIIGAVNGTTASTLTDASGNTWSITKGQVVVNGAVDPTTANVTHLAYVDGQIWQENTSDLWWSKTTPASGWSPTYGTSIVPVPVFGSSDNSVFGVDKNNGSSALIVDKSDNIWSIVSGQVVVNGTVDPTTANVVELAYVNGNIWQENASGLWWSKSAPTDAWSPTYGTSTNPLQDAAVNILNYGDVATTINIGEMSKSISTPPQVSSVDNLVTSGVKVSGTSVTFNSPAGETRVIVDGNSSITATGSLALTGYYRPSKFTPQFPNGPLQNNGTMTLDDSTLTAGILSGTGSINATNGSIVNIGAATSSSETILLQDSHLNIDETLAFLATPTPLVVNSPITMGIGSGITLTSIVATAAQYNPTTGDMLLWTGSSSSGYQEVADLKIPGLTHVYAQEYATTPGGALSTLLSVNDMGHSLPPPLT